MDTKLNVDQVKDLEDYLQAKQAALVSGENIKTVNGESLLGGGNLQFTGDGGLIPETTASNIGDGEGVFSAKVSNDLRFKSIEAGPNVTVESTGSTVKISSVSPPTETTASNVGPGTPVFDGKSGDNLRFRTLTAGDGILISGTPGSDVRISNTQTPGLSGIQSVGTGQTLYGGMSGNSARIKSLVAGNNITLSSTNNTVTISAEGGGGGGGSFDGIIGNGDSIDRPYENYVMTGGTQGWPDRTTPGNSLLRIGLGTKNNPVTVVPGNAPTGIFVQNFVNPGFTGDSAAYYVGGASFDVIAQGGIGGLTGVAATVYKLPGTYTGDTQMHGARFGVDARKATDYRGILTGLWAFVHTDRNGTGGIAPAIEINAFQSQVWNPDTHYSHDPFPSNGKRRSIGLLINNYQHAAMEFGGSAGNYQNAYGIAVTSLGPGGIGGRAFGYQTGLYLTECSQEAIRIRGGIESSNSLQTKYGIKFEGTACSVAGIHLGPNKINWGEYLLASFNNGDMWANSGALYYRAGGINREVVTSESDFVSGDYTADRKIAIRRGGQTFYLLASTTP